METVTINRTELEGMEERIRKLSMDKSHLQLIIDLMNNVTAAQGLENTIEALLNNIVKVIGGTNIVLYYLVDDELYRADLLCKSEKIRTLEDDMAARVFQSREPLEIEGGFGDTRMLTPEFCKAYTWVFPLHSGRELIGVIKLENLQMDMRELFSHLPVFFTYVASTLKNEIRSHTNLQMAYDRLLEANAEVRRSYEELKRARIELLQRDKMASVGRLASGVAHEINTPAQYIMNNSIFLGDAFQDVLNLIPVLFPAPGGGEEVKGKKRAELADLFDFYRKEIPAAIRQNLEGISAISNIIATLKEFARDDFTGKEEVDINRAVENIIAVSANMWKTVADIETEFDPGLPSLVCSPGELNQAILNLIINSIQAIKEAGDRDPKRPKGLIRVRTRARNGGIDLMVSDTGTGIPEDLRDTIFEPFFTTKDTGDGMGLGLAVTYDIIVRRHGGSISVSSDPGKGSEFTVFLPATEDPQGRR